MLSLISQALNTLGPLTGLLAAVGVAVWGWLKLFGNKMIEARFNNELEAIRHAHAQELSYDKHGYDEQLEDRKAIHAANLDRRTKLHAEEFQTLPHVRTLMLHAISDTENILRKLQSSPALTMMGERQRDHYLRSQSIPKWQRDKLAESDNMDREFSKILGKIRLKKATDSYVAFHNTLQEKAPFIPPTLKVAFLAMGQIIQNALSEYLEDLEDSQLGLPRKKSAEFVAGAEFHKLKDKLTKEIEAMVVSRIRDDYIS